MDRSDRFEDIFSVVDVGLFIESPSRLIPYMRHHGFDEKEILCVKTIADSHPDELSDIIGDEDPRKAEATIARVARTPGVDRIISASILQDLRDASNVKMKRDAFSSKKYEPVCVDAYSNGGRPASDDMMFVIVPDGEAKVDRYSGNEIDVVIPDVINFGGEEYRVTGINEWAFERCSSMESVRLPSMLASIGEKAFVGCSRLKSVTIPKHLKAIGKDAFEKCPGLEWFAVDRENRHFSTDSQGILYSEDKKRLIKAPCGVSGEIWIPLEVTSIEDKAFEGCSELSRVSMGPGVSSIGDWAFSKCFHLRSVALSDGLVAIGNGTFHECYGLTEIAIPESVRSIGARAFSGCSSMTSATLGEGLRSIEKWAFELCQSLTSIYIPSTVSSIGDEAFTMCTSLRRYQVGLGNNWYRSDSNGLLYDRRHNVLIKTPRAIFGSIDVLPGTVTIYERAFEGCSKMTSLNLPSSISTIGRRAFKGCVGLERVRIPKSVKCISDSAFSECASLESVEIPEGVTKIGCGAFERCPSLKSVKLPSSLKSIGYGAFDPDVEIVRRCRHLMRMTMRPSSKVT
ncbi:MAG: leucine-rich repeat domain-containing protein [Candidatus Methanomethylophilaceae archaeon]|nr:leucine-rich repeat domain-containing protein [Candidatus Methanomethylophilaceae archaeon]